MKKTFELKNKNIAFNPFLNDNKNGEYFAVLENNLKNLQYLQNTSKMDRKICTLLQIPNYVREEEKQYWQGVAELLIWFLSEKKGVEYSTEIKLSENSNKDIDVRIDGKISLNIEVKSPEIIIFDKSSDTVIRDIPFRTGQHKDELLEEGLEFAEMLIDAPGSPYSKSKVQFPIDNQLCDALIDSDLKFPNSNESNINIVFIPTTTEMMGKYWRILTNGQTGFLTPNCPEIKNKKIFNIECMKRINFVVLSNAITINQKFDANSWDIEKAFNLVLSNCNCQYRLSDSNMQYIEQFFNAKTCDFYYNYVKHIEEIAREDNGIDAYEAPFVAFMDFFEKYIKENNI